MGRFSQVRNVPGVYLLIDLDEKPLYVGKSGKLRDRLEQHFIRQDSSATADGLLDIYDVKLVVAWYADREPVFPLEAYESAAYLKFPPRWNRAVPVHSDSLPELTIENADVAIGILNSAEELAVRGQALERIEAKLLHLLRAVRKAKISGASPGVRRALARHAQELSELFDRLLDRAR
jgi:hypothetical protein